MRQSGVDLSHGFPLQLQLVHVVQQPIKYRVGQRRILDDFIMPPSLIGLHAEPAFSSLQLARQ